MPYPTLQTILGVGLETVTGTAVAPTSFIPVASAPKPTDKLKMDPDKGMRGSMGVDYGFIAGVYNTEYAFDSYVFPDTVGFALAGCLGDVVSSGGTNVGSSTTSSTAMTGGTTTTFTVLSGTGITVGTILNLTNGALTELVTCITGTTGTTVVVSRPVINSYSGTTTVQPVTAPFTTVFSLYNGTNGQPPTYTFTDWYAANGRQYPAGTFSGASFKLTGDGLLSYSATALANPSVSLAGAKPTASYSTLKPLSGWQGVATIGGSETGTVLSCDLDIKREVKPINVVNGSQTPANLWAAALSVSGKLSLLVNTTTDSDLNYYLNNTQPSLDLNWSVGSGASLVQVKWHMTQCAFTVADIDRGKDEVLIDVTFTAVFNTTDVGSSAGYSPIKVTVQNAVAPRTYK